ncbi:Resolvase, Holliday junction-type [Nitrosotalea sinensis]|uniref:Resolvase, Holliday junction-type n=1 Tax=Nitrosotalea sinensis TaxID=1499975 RepID=A0A2H1EI88_9ARCH|nr:resolvase [Candidatus Nitrosotalea sinensis]SHO46661.1 Resolvase, Holliday junction-type [Candidatus Nitrosotalea sinensis]
MVLAEYPELDKKVPVRNKNRKTVNQRIARTRRQRGYHWEDTLVKRFNAVEGWKAFRLGSPSVGLPDILAVSTKENVIYTIEAKSGTNTTLRVPFDQIQRCLKWIHTFELYQTRKMVVAFKFSSKKRIGTGKYEHRELREYFKIWDEKYPVTDFICTYDGDTYAMTEGKRLPLNLESCVMPFIK